MPDTQNEPIITREGTVDDVQNQLYSAPEISLAGLTGQHSTILLKLFAEASSPTVLWIPLLVNALSGIMPSLPAESTRPCMNRRQKVTAIGLFVDDLDMTDVQYKEARLGLRASVFSCLAASVDIRVCAARITSRRGLIAQHKTK